MRIRNYVLAGLLGVATQAAVELGVPARAAESDVPRFLVDPYWPKPLPNRWVTGAVGGAAARIARWRALGPVNLPCCAVSTGGSRWR